ncbi:MAG: hypothetical protein AAB316_24320 [Bacteroidota bacterium]
MQFIEVIVGLVFTFLLLSLLGTTLNELIAAWRGWRGFYLEEGLKRLLEFKDDPTIFEKFKKNPLYRQFLADKVPLRVSTAPAYLSSANFTSILSNVLKNKDKAVTGVEDFIAGLPPESQLRQVLEQLRDEGHQEVATYKLRLQSWFDDVMNQASGWYKRHLQVVTLLVGLGIAVGLNADAFKIYNHLTTNSVARRQLTSLAEIYVQQNQNLPTPGTPGSNLSGTQIREEINKMLKSDDFSKVSNILGLGWRQADFMVYDWRVWLSRLAGWLVTALAISLGAPFWFDILKKIITIRSSGNAVASSGTVTPQVVINASGPEVEVKK